MASPQSRSHHVLFLYVLPILLVWICPLSIPAARCYRVDPSPNSNFPLTSTNKQAATDAGPAIIADDSREATPPFTTTSTSIISDQISVGLRDSISRHYIYFKTIRTQLELLPIVTELPWNVFRITSMTSSYLREAHRQLYILNIIDAASNAPWAGAHNGEKRWVIDISPPEPHMFNVGRWFDAIDNECRVRVAYLKKAKMFLERHAVGGTRKGKKHLKEYGKLINMYEEQLSGLVLRARAGVDAYSRRVGVKPSVSVPAVQDEFIGKEMLGGWPDDGDGS